MTLVLPPPVVAGDAWPDRELDVWDALADRAETIRRTAGTGHRFPPVLVEARRLLEARDTATVRERLHGRLFARAVAEIWATDRRTAQRSMTPAVLGAVAASGAVSRGTAHSLVSALLTYYDELDDWEGGRFEAARQAVARAVSGCRTRDQADVVEVLRTSPHLVAAADGPRLLARELIAQGRRLEDDPTARALCGDDQGRYAQVLRDEYYLALIASADASVEGHPFLTDATGRATRLRRDSEDRRFGIAVLSALCDKPDVVPSGQWVDAALAIGGDPRHEQSTTWHEWWGHVDPDLRARAVRWMSGADLRAFLDAVQLYGEESGNDSLQRMFPRRQRFLLGLYESGLVRNARLILGDDIRATVRRVTNVSLLDAPRFVDQAKDTAVVMVDCGDFHLVEGSHSFRLHVYMGPPGPELAEPRNRGYTRHQLINVIPSIHRNRHPDGADSYAAWTHDASGGWVRGALDFLRERGITLEESKLLTDDDLTSLVRRRAGRAPAAPLWRRR
ncbi:EH signature protein [Isoptericola jiangsuensis]|uniref:EH signature protein n=1 Tax=Isoptericola jiangsuensis TaxID=548579 RepID=A0A2A9ETF1_9MICO|nr:EH signature domain-containing protein [Isoptericola jiangsuensis]PFG42417.1 EH signature protein [Isoptericola jiangsuensis]